MLESQYTDLVTPGQVATLAFGSLGSKIQQALESTGGSGDAGQIQQGCLQIIRSVTRIMTLIWLHPWL
jgi:hypothetical protein